MTFVGSDVVSARLLLHISERHARCKESCAKLRMRKPCDSGEPFIPRKSGSSVAVAAEFLFVFLDYVS